MSQFGNATSGQNPSQSARKERRVARALTARSVMPRGRGKKFPNYRLCHKTRPPIRH
jgi:hypothetical protein